MWKGFAAYQVSSTTKASPSILQFICEFSRNYASKFVGQLKAMYPFVVFGLDFVGVDSAFWARATERAGRVEKSWEGLTLW